MSKRLAKLTSDILNPFLVSFVTTLLLAFKATSGTAEALKWAAIATAFSVLPVWLIVIYLVRRHKLDGIFANSRPQRTIVYLMAGLCGILGGIVLYYLEAPTLLVATFVAGLASIAVFMGINLMWKISLHTAFTAAAAAVLIIVFGAAAAPAVVLLPLVGWARVALGSHSPAQAIAGALVAAAIVFTVFYLFGFAGARA
jgi:membrane-associated phospholipid phosphatase